MLARTVSETVVTVAVLALSGALLLHGATGSAATTATGAIWAILAYWFTRAGHSLGTAQTAANAVNTGQIASAVTQALATAGQTEAQPSSTTGTGVKG